MESVNDIFFLEKKKRESVSKNEKKGTKIHFKQRRKERNSEGIVNIRRWNLVMGSLKRVLAVRSPQRMW